MATNLNIDVDLLDQAYQLGGFRTKRETVEQALREFIHRRKQQEVLRFLNNVEYEPDSGRGSGS